VRSIWRSDGMGNDDEDYRTILGNLGPWLISHHVRSWDWESFARREPKPARERLGPLALWKPERRPRRS
jgi:hypothetical protein